MSHSEAGLPATSQKRKNRKIDVESPEWRLAVLLNKYVIARIALERAGLPQDRSITMKLLANTTNDKRLNLASQPMSHVTLTADGWERVSGNYCKDGVSLMVDGDSVTLLLGDETRFRSGIYTINDLTMAVKSLYLIEG
jgi:hypothetical protein